ncbi:MAG: outer membrane beta-barrel family protein [Flavobacteriaceae bacterium]|nr:outer membrane beta-barrel family protein [Flavobacteriaceae bacterium]
MLTRIFTILAGLLFTMAFSQEFRVSGKIVDSNTNPVAFANILLLKATDSTTVTGTFTEEDGSFLLENIAADSYILNITYLGYAELMVPVSVNGSTELENIIMTEVTEGLDEVSVIARRPTLTRSADRLVFNISNTALTEGNVLQVIKNTPSLIVIDDNITIKGQSPEIYINNRKVRLSSSELTSFLESAPANSIKSVEVITNPPASYDASSGSVVNIVMDGKLISGYQGSAGIEYGQGRFPRYEASTNHFFKGEKSSFNLNYGYNNSKELRDNDDVIDYFDNNNEIEEIWDSDIKRVTTTETHTLTLNYDYDIDDRNSIGVSTIGLFSPDKETDLTNIAPITDINGNFLSRFEAFSFIEEDLLNISADLDYSHDFKNESRLSVNGHFTFYEFEMGQNVNNLFYDQSNTLADKSNFDTNSNQETKIYSGKIDYSYPIEESANLQTGVMYGIVDTGSDILRLDRINGEEVVNDENTDQFEYEEKIAAAYFNFSKDWEKVNLSIGVRAEHTDILGVSQSDNLVNEQDYLKWFPNASLLYKVTDAVSIWTNYKKSIQRPDYSYLNPFRYFINENITVTGNPGLQPIITDAFKTGVQWGDFTFEAYLDIMEDQIYKLPLQDNQNNTIAYTPVNIDRAIEFGFDFLYTLQINDDWYVSAITSFYRHNDINTFNGEKFELEQWSNYSVLQTGLSLLKDRSLKLNAVFVYTSQYLDILAIVEPRLFSDLSISKSIMEGKGIISLSASDMFNTADFRSVTRYLNQSNVYASDLDTRYVTLGFRYKFGNTGLDTNKRTISTEEDERLSNSNQ